MANEINKRKFFKTRIVVDVLSDEPYNPSTIAQVAYDITDGSCLGSWNVENSRELDGREAVVASEEMGSDCTWFDLDPDGSDAVDIEDNRMAAASAKPGFMEAAAKGQVCPVCGASGEIFFYLKGEAGIAHRVRITCKYCDSTWEQPPNVPSGGIGTVIIKAKPFKDVALLGSGETFVKESYSLGFVLREYRGGVYGNCVIGCAVGDSLSEEDSWVDVDFNSIEEDVAEQSRAALAAVPEGHRLCRMDTDSEPVGPKPSLPLAIPGYMEDHARDQKCPNCEADGEQFFHAESADQGGYIRVKCAYCGASWVQAMPPAKFDPRMVAAVPGFEDFGPLGVGFVREAYSQGSVLREFEDGVVLCCTVGEPLSDHDSWGEVDFFRIDVDTAVETRKALAAVPNGHRLCKMPPSKEPRPKLEPSKEPDSGMGPS